MRMIICLRMRPIHDKKFCFLLNNIANLYKNRKVMEKLYLEPTELSPEIILSPEDNVFKITGRSSPEDVRTLYYPVIDWIKNFVKVVIEGNSINYSEINPFVFKFEFTYFNSSSAKFIYDILVELKNLHQAGIPTVIEWVYEEGDTDLMEAGNDIAILSEMEFKYIGKKY